VTTIRVWQAGHLDSRRSFHTVSYVHTNTYKMPCQSCLASVSLSPSSSFFRHSLDVDDDVRGCPGVRDYRRAYPAEPSDMSLAAVASSQQVCVRSLLSLRALQYAARLPSCLLG
jgi:hypothetical protein